MREIKFKVWDTEEEKFINNCAFEEYQPLNDIFKNHWYVFLQYTGLKDKNGVEIYEGDIVRFDIDSEYSIIEFKYSAFILGWGKGDYQEECLLANCNKGCYVVGNIYENPELIEE